jgi:hypothetical protein
MEAHGRHIWSDVNSGGHELDIVREENGRGGSDCRRGERPYSMGNEPQPSGHRSGWGSRTEPRTLEAEGQATGKALRSKDYALARSGAMAASYAL